MSFLLPFTYMTTQREKPYKISENIFLAYDFSFAAIVLIPMDMK